MLVVLYIFCLTTQAQLKAPPTTNEAVFETTLKTVAVYPRPNNINDPSRTLYSPVISIESERPLVCEFDDLTNRFRSLRYKIFHCNADWQRSVLNDIEFTYEYNDYAINDYQQSFNTKIPYTHYRFEIPRLKLSGNYVLVVYEDKRPVKPLFTKRFMVYEPKVSIWAEVRLSSGIKERYTHQQIDFDLNHKGYEIFSPEALKIFVRQNGRWDKVLSNIRPSSVRTFDAKIEYRPFDLSNNMLGGNDFRWFDTRSARATGMTVSDVKQMADQTLIYVRPDKPRSSGGSFMQMDDLNGGFIVLNKDTENSTNEADYLNVVFTLKQEEIPNGAIYVNGAFNNWQLNDNNRMTFNVEKQVYEASIYIKQGLVNYNYVLLRNDKLDETALEGNYSATSNDYEILVYYRPPANRADVLIGYRLLNFRQ